MNQILVTAPPSSVTDFIRAAIFWQGLPAGEQRKITPIIGRRLFNLPLRQQCEIILMIWPIAPSFSEVASYHIGRRVPPPPTIEDWQRWLDEFNEEHEEFLTKMEECQTELAKTEPRLAKLTEAGK